MSVKRKRSDLTLDIKHGLGRLQETIDHLNSSSMDLPSYVKTLIELIQTQTAMIEALAACQHNKLTKYQSLTAYVRRDRMLRHQNYNTKHGRQAKTNDNHSKQCRLSAQTPSTYTSPPRTSTRCSLQTKRQSTRTSIKTSNSPWHEPAPPPPPPKDEKYSSHSRPCSTNTSPKARLTTHPDPNSKTRPSPSTPFSTDLFYESLAHRATNSLASIPKSTPLPLGPLDNGTITLHSHEYQRHQSHKPTPTPSQSPSPSHGPNTLLVYSHSPTWTTDFPGIPAPRPGEVAMELIVYPSCLLIVKPFAVPRYAACEWKVLEALGDHAVPTTVEVMFLGRGLVRVRVRLSDLTGGRRNGRDQWIEFAGVWRPSVSVVDEAGVGVGVGEWSSEGMI